MATIRFGAHASICNESFGMAIPMEISESPQRLVLSLTDAIVGGQGEGPLSNRSHCVAALLPAHSIRSQPSGSILA